MGYEQADYFNDTETIVYIQSVTDRDYDGTYTTTLDHGLSPYGGEKRRVPGPNVPRPGAEAGEVRESLRITSAERNVPKEGREAPRHTSEDTMLRNDELGMYGVFDGMGSGPGGDVASRTAADFIENRARQLKAGEINIDPADAEDNQRFMEAALIVANEELNEKQENNPALSGMVTTATILHRFRDAEGKEMAAYASAGDSGLLRMRDGKAEFITREECLAQQPNVLTNSLNGNQSFQVDTEHNVGVIELQLGDRLVLLSDGIIGDWENERLSMDEYEAVLDPAHNPDPEEAIDALIEKSRKVDDKGVIVLDVEGGLSTDANHPDAVIPDRYLDREGNYDPMLEYVDMLEAGELPGVGFTADHDAEGEHEAANAHEASPERPESVVEHEEVSRLHQFINTCREKTKNFLPWVVTGAQMRWQTLEEAERHKRTFIKLAIGAAAVYGAYKISQEIQGFTQGGGDVGNGVGGSSSPAPETIDLTPEAAPEATPEDVSDEVGRQTGYIIETGDGYEVTAMPGPQTDSVWRAAEHALEHRLGRQPNIYEIDALQDILGEYRLDAGENLVVRTEQIDQALAVARRYTG